MLCQTPKNNYVGRYCNVILNIFLFFHFQAFSNIFGRKLIQTKPKNVARNAEWAASEFEVFSQSGEDGIKQENSHQSRLNVLNPNSPYGLIQNVISPDLPKSKPIGHDRVSDLGGLTEDDVWLSDGDLLILKGGTTSFISNSIDGSEPAYPRPSIYLNNGFNENNAAVTYANSGKLAIAPAPPSITSNYVNQVQQIKHNAISIDNKPLTRVPKQIKSNSFETFVPKNTQIPWPENHNTINDNNLLNEPITYGLEIQPIQKVFKPSEKLRLIQNLHPPKNHQQYTLSIGNAQTHGLPQTAKSSGVISRNENLSNLVLRPPHTYPIQSNWLSTTAGTSTTPPNFKISSPKNYIRNNNNRKVFHIHHYSPSTQQQQQQRVSYNHKVYPQRKQSVNPLLEYLKSYAIRNKRPLSTMTGTANCHYTNQPLQLSGVRGKRINNTPPINAQQRTPKVLNNGIRNQEFKNHYNKNNLYVSNSHISGHKITSPPDEYNNQFLQQSYSKPATSYIKKKTQFLDYLTYIKPLLPNFVRNNPS